MNRQVARKCLIIAAALTFSTVSAHGAEPDNGLDRAAFKAGLAPLSADVRARAAEVGREVANRALAITHCVTLQPRLKLAAERRAQVDRS